MTQTLTFVRLGTRYPGRCPRCGADISRPWEMEAALLYRRADGRYYPVCAPCAGARTKSRVGGGVALAVALDGDTVVIWARRCDAKSVTFSAAAGAYWRLFDGRTSETTKAAAREQLIADARRVAQEARDAA